MTELTKPPSPNPIATRLHITCGDCLFFSRQKLPDYKSTCHLLGVAASRAPCRMFSPNVLTESIAQALDDKALRAALNAIPDGATGALAVAITKAAKLRAAGFKVGQVVYFNVIGVSSDRDYVANYYKGRIVMLNLDGDAMIVGSNKITATINPATLLTVKQWKAKRSDLIKRGKLVDPKSPFTWERKDEKVLTSDKYRPAWLDEAITKYRADVMEARIMRQTHDYDSAPVKRKRGRPKKSDTGVKTYTMSAA